MQRILLIILALGLSATGAGADDSDKKTKARKAWQHRYETVFKAARTSGKPVLIEFYVDWCGTCKRMGKETLAEKPVQTTLGRFETAKVNCDDYPQLAKDLRVDYLPTFIILSPEGTILDRAKGFLDSLRFRKLLDGAIGRREGLAGQSTKFRKAAELERAKAPQTADARLAYGAFLRSRGNLPTARKLYASLAAADSLSKPTRLRATILLVELCALMQRFEEGLRRVHAGRILEPKNPLTGHLLFLEAWCYEKQENQRKAWSSYHGLIHLYPDTRAAKKAAERLGRLGL